MRYSDINRFFPWSSQLLKWKVLRKQYLMKRLFLKDRFTKFFRKSAMDNQFEQRLFANWFYSETQRFIILVTQIKKFTLWFMITKVSSS